MIRPLIAIGALVVLAAVEARYEDGGRVSYKHEEHYSNEPYGDNKYDDGYGKKHVAYDKSYKHEPEYYEEYKEPSYGKYEEYDHKPTYNYKYEPAYRHSVYGYGGDSYGKSYNSYGGDSYGKSYSTYSSYKPESYRHKREAQVLVPLGIEREGLQNRFRRILSVMTKTGEQPGANTDSKIEFSISGEAVSGTNECQCQATLNAVGRDDFEKGAVDRFGRKVLRATGNCFDRRCSGKPIVTLENTGTNSWFVEWVEVSFDDGTSCRSKGRIGWLDDPTKQDPVTCCEKSWTGTLC